MPGRRFRLASALLVALFLLGPGSAAAALTEFTLPTPGARPAGIAVGPDRALWVAEYGAGKIARVLTTGETTEFPLPAYEGVPSSERRPLDIVLGPDNALWATDVRRDALVRITTSGQISEFFAGMEPTNLTSGPGPALWYVGDANVVGRMTTGGAVTTFPLQSAAAADIAAGSDGALWLTLPTDSRGSSASQIDNQVARMTTAGALTEVDLPTAASDPQGLAAGPDGALWFVERGANKIGRITTAGVLSEYAIPSSGTGPTQIASGPDGALWFTETTADRIGWVNTSGTVRDCEALPTGSAPDRIVSGPDGALWVTEPGRNRLGRVTTACPLASGSAGGGPSPGTGSTPGAGGGAASGSGRARIAGRGLRLGSDGLYRLRLACAAAASRCRGVVRLESLRRLDAGSARPRRILLARRTFSLRGGSSRLLRMRVSRRGRQLVRRRGSLRVRLLIRSRLAGRDHRAIRTFRLRSIR
jgi:virginiamycin B lyase